MRCQDEGTRTLHTDRLLIEEISQTAKDHFFSLRCFRGWLERIFSGLRHGGDNIGNGDSKI